MSSSLAKSLYGVVQRGVTRALDAYDVVTTRTLDERLTSLKNYLEEKIVTTAQSAADTAYDQALTRVAAYFGVLLAENASLRNSVAEKDAALSAANEHLAGEGDRTKEAVASAVQSALDLDAQKDLARVEEILRQAGADLPAPVPPVEVPPAGEPADVPTDDIDPVDEGSLPVTDPTTTTVDPVPSDPATAPGSAAGVGDVIDPGEAGDDGDAPFPHEDPETPADGSGTAGSDPNDSTASTDTVVDNGVPPAGDVAETGSADQPMNADNV